MTARIILCAIMGVFVLHVQAIEKMTSEIYPLGLIDFETAEKIANDIVSPGGKLLADKARNRLILYDYPTRHEALREALAQIPLAIKHVHIRVIFKEKSPDSSHSVSTDKQTPDTKNSSLNESTSIQDHQSNSFLSPIIQQNLVIMSGGKAHIQISMDVPYADWLWNYGLKRKLWSGTTPWKGVRTQIFVEPYVLTDGQIRLRLTPEFNYLLNQEPCTTTIEKLMTELIVHDGDEVDLSRLTFPDRDFYSKFLIGYNQQGEKQVLPIALKITIEASLD